MQALLEKEDTWKIVMSLEKVRRVEDLDGFFRMIFCFYLSVHLNIL